VLVQLKTTYEDPPASFPPPSPSTGIMMSAFTL